MVDKQIVLDTIKKMLDSGLDEKVIRSTLKDVGLSENEINSYWRESQATKTPSPAAPVSSAPETVEAEETPSFSEDFPRSSSAPKSPSNEENRLLHTTTHAALEQSNQSIEDLSNRFASLETQLQAFAQLPLKELNDKITRFDKKISDLSKDILETKAQTQALREVLEKVLDTNRSILSELEERKS